MSNGNENEAANRSQRYDINRPRPRHGPKYTKYKICVSIMMVIFTKQHLSSIWSSFHENVNQHWGWVEERIAYKKSVYYLAFLPKCVSMRHF